MESVHGMTNACAHVWLEYRPVSIRRGRQTRLAGKAKQVGFAIQACPDIEGPFDRDRNGHSAGSGAHHDHRHERGKAAWGTRSIQAGFVRETHAPLGNFKKILAEPAANPVTRLPRFLRTRNAKVIQRDAGGLLRRLNPRRVSWMDIWSMLPAEGR
jgi:hypothetical protein